MDAATGAQIAHRNPADQAGFTMYPNAILTAGQVSLGARVLYGLLKMYAWQSGQAWPGQDRLGTDMGVSARQVRTYLAELEAANLISREQRGLTQTNKYWIEPIPATFLSDRKNTSGQGGNNTSVQDRKPTSDKEYAVEEYSKKNSESTAPAPQMPYPANPTSGATGDMDAWEAVGHREPKGTPVTQQSTRPTLVPIPKAKDDPTVQAQWLRVLATYPHQAGKCSAPIPTELAFMLKSPAERDRIEIATGHYAAYIAAEGGFARHLKAFIEDGDYTQWQTPATPRPARSSDPTRPPAPTYRILNAPAATSA